MCTPHFFLASERRSTFDVRRRPGYKNWRLLKFSSILLSFKTRHWLFILIYINFGKFKLEKAPIFVTRPASNVDRRTPFGSENKMRNAHISEMRSNSASKIYVHLRVTSQTSMFRSHSQFVCIWNTCEWSTHMLVWLHVDHPKTGLYVVVVLCCW
jgi:hypothetical protein